MDGPPEDLFQIAQLIDQLRHDDIVLRQNAAKGVVKIARALGPERTRDELIPFIGESIDDEDSVVLVYAEKLGELVDYVGGSHYCYKLLETLGQLCAAEEAVVRDMTICSLEKVVVLMSEEHLEKYFVPLVVKLATKEWYTCRASAACLVHLAYCKLSDERRASFRSMFVKLCADETPIVRKLAARNLGRVSYEIIKLDQLPQDFIRTFTQLASDDQDAVRIENIMNGVALSELLAVEQKHQHVLPVIMRMSEDKAWRVRWCLIQKLHDLGKGVLSLPVSTSTADARGPTGSTRHINVEPENYTNIQITIVNSLEQVAESLLTDSESEVRSAAAANMQHYCRLFRRDRIISVIVPCIQKLAVDQTSEYVRTSVATSINELSVLLGKDGTVEHLLPQLLILLRDSASPVRLGIISNLDVLNRVIGVELLSQSLIPAVIDLANDSKWRVRIAVIELMPMLVAQLGLKFFTEKLCDLTLGWLSDKVYTIRRAAAENLKALTEQFGEPWALRCILPRLEELKKNTNYLHRIICLYGIQTVAPGFSEETQANVLVPLAVELSSDSVANIRFSAAKTLSLLHTLISERNNNNPSLQQVTKCLNRLLVDDVDKDVKFFVKQALSRIPPE